MNTMCKIEIDFYGTFSRFSSNDPVLISLNQGSTISQLKLAIFELLREYDDGNLQSLINVSAIADDNQIYQKDFVINEDAKFAILPPVNGG